MIEGASIGPADEGRRFAQYRVERRADGSLWQLGSGAMGVTYKAWDEKLRVLVALKVITPAQVEDPAVQALFLREARVAAKVRHPNVASILTLCDTPGNYFYAMEYIDGVPLGDWLRQRGRLPPVLALDLAMQIAHGLAAIHEKHLVHRDLKPSNLMLLPLKRASGGEAWRVKIIDFGLARPILREADTPRTVGFRGTTLYASPEQCEEMPDLDGRSDLYSLGCILWQMLLGAPPFLGRSHRELLNQHAAMPVPLEKLAPLPASLRVILARLLEKDREDRYPQADALLQALEQSSESLLSGRERGGTEALPRAESTERPRTESALGRVSTDRTGAAATRPGTTLRLGPRGILLALAVVTLLLGGLGAGLWLRFQPARAERAASPALSEKSVAVLPFEDASENRADAFFADGIQDDVLTSLTKIRALSVIGRSSSQRFRGEHDKARLKEIGEALGVAYVLEGRVRRAGARVILSVVLTDTRNSLQVWAERYDRNLTDSLSLQGELAQEIARELRATLSPEEKAQVSTQPTGNAEAYVLYLQAREHQTKPVFLRREYEATTALLSRALTMDPTFALAHARYSEALSYAYLNFQPSEELKIRALAEADEALRLQPNLGEGYLARALCLYRTARDYEGALRVLQDAARLLPSEVEVVSSEAFIRRRQGRWLEALAGLERALTRDPKNPRLAREAFATNYELRDWPAAARAGDRAVAVASNELGMRLERAYQDFWSRGDLAPLQAVLAAAKLGPDPIFTLARWDAALLARDYPAAERALAENSAPALLGVFGTPLPRDYLLGCVALAQAQAARAQPHFEAARPAMEAEVAALPLDVFRRAQLGLLYAYLGRKDDALREGRRAVAELPESKDAFGAHRVAGQLAVICARVGETSQALEMVERLLTVPGGVSRVMEGSMTQADLRVRWQWDPLRGEARFEKLVSGPEPKTVAR